MRDLIKVGMADLKVIKHPGVLTTLGLGSCVGICIYDPVSKVTGMAHIMLPSSQAIRNNSNPAKFADTAVELMLGEMLKHGADKSRLICKMAGGAQMFSFQSKNDMMKIGERNAEAVRDLMKQHRIPVKADDTGGSFGRTIEFDSKDGSLLIKTIGHGTKQV